MNNRYRGQAAAMLSGIGVALMAGLLLRHEALRSPMELPPEPGFPIAYLGWWFLTVLILCMTLHGLVTSPNLSQKTQGRLKIALGTLALLYAGSWVFLAVIGQGFAGERLLAGLTASCGGIGALLLAHLTKDPLIYKSIVIYGSSLVFLGIGIWYIITYFTR